MKKYDRIRTLPLVEVFNSYIEHNGLSLAYAARCTKIPYTNTDCIRSIRITQYLTVVDITISIESTDAISTHYRVCCHSYKIVA